MLAILTAYLVWFPSLLGLGTLALSPCRKAFGDPDPSRLLVVATFGLATLGTLAITANFFLAVGPRISLLFLLAGWLLLLVNHRLILDTIAATWPYRRRTFVLAASLVLLWTALAARYSPTLYDDGLYHLQAIKWVTQSRLPLGLANLHGRFGFNSTWLPIAAALEAPFLVGKGIFLVNGLLYAAYGMAIAAAVGRLRSLEMSASSIFMALTSIAWLFPPLYGSGGAGTASSDLPVVLLSLTTVFLTIRALEPRPWEDRRRDAALALAVSVLAATVKLSSAPLMIAPAVALAVVLCTRRAPGVAPTPAKARTLPPAAILAALLVAWLLRGIMLSGYPAYPSTIGGLHLPWTVPAARARSDALAIMSWARQPHQPPDAVLANWDWLLPWLRSFRATPLFALAAALSCAGLAQWLIAGRRALSRDEVRAVLCAAVALLAGAAFWFLTAPDPRFGAGYIWSLAFLAMASGAHRLYTAYPILALGLRRMLMLGTLAILVYIAVIAMRSSLAGHGRIDLRGVLLSWPSIPQEHLETKLTAEGVTVFTPISGEDQCWDAPVPCTPYLDGMLQILTDASGWPREFRAGAE